MQGIQIQIVSLWNLRATPLCVLFHTVISWGRGHLCFVCYKDVETKVLTPGQTTCSLWSQDPDFLNPILFTQRKIQNICPDTPKNPQSLED